MSEAIKSGSLSQAMEFGRQLCRALGVPANRVSRVVIAVDLEDGNGTMPRFYVKGHFDAEAAASIVRAVGDVTVSADGEVTVEPLPIAAEIP